MASVKVAPKTPFAFENSPSKPRDDSFSTYLAFVRENFPPELGDSSPERLSCQISLNPRRTIDGEIDIFDAEKYFSGVMDGDAPQAPVNGRGTPTKKEVKLRVRAKSRTCSTSSETSCNSRSTLLRDHHRRREIHCGQRPEASYKKFLGVFPCSCARKNAIDVDKEAVSDTKKQLAQSGERGGGGDDLHLVSDLRLKRVSPGLRQEVFAFPPNLNSVARKVTAKDEEEKVGGVPKVVFGANFNQKGEVVSSQRRSFGMVTSSGKIVGGGGGGGGGGGNGDDDVRSEASSDLFEIESLSMNSHPFISHEGTESVTTTGYEPSEASVEWSVVTASVANFSIASESDDQRANLRKPRRSSGSAGLLLGCVSEKAVNVTAGGAGPTKMCERTSTDRWESTDLDGGPVTPTARYRVESCGVDLGPGRAGRVIPPSPFGSSRSSQD